MRQYRNTFQEKIFIWFSGKTRKVNGVNSVKGQLSVLPRDIANGDRRKCREK